MKQYTPFLVALACAFILAGCADKSEPDITTVEPESDETVSDMPIEQEEAESAETWDLIPMVMVNGTLYLDTGRESTVEYRCGVMDGTITSTVDGSETPTIDGQSNFGAGYGFQYGPTEGTIEIYMNEKWWVFATEDVRQELQFPPEEPTSDSNTVADFETVLELSAEDAAEISNIVCTGIWTDGTPDCIPDCMITIDGTMYDYHSDCSAIIDTANNRWFELSADEKTALNTILGNYILLRSDPVPTE